MTNKEMITARMEREMERDAHLYPGYKIEIDDCDWKINGMRCPAFSGGFFHLHEAIEIYNVTKDY